MQGDLRDFEENLARYVGVKHAIGLGNCTDALLLAVRCAGINAGDEVIFPSHTMVASPAAIYYAGAIPVPADCGDDHLIDPASVRKAITKKTRAIMPVQLNGRVANMAAIESIAHEFGLLIIEDAAQALGGKFRGRMAGTFGIAAGFSFYPAKTLGCFGDGGALVTNDDEVARKVRLIRDHGRNPEGDVELWGLNTRLDNLQAAILDHQLKTYDRIVARRRAIAAQYQRQLKNIRQLMLPPAPDSDVDHFDVFQNYEIEAERRDELRAFLKDRGIGTLIQWGGKAVHQFKALKLNVRLPRTELLFERCLMLPLNPALTDDDVGYVSQTIRDFYRR
jgi:dTDP-4-amino-4,6-dideoxygalactose transaminase